MDAVLSGEALMTQQTIEHIAKVVEEKGTDVWWQVRCFSYYVYHLYSF